MLGKVIVGLMENGESQIKLSAFFRTINELQKVIE